MKTEKLHNVLSNARVISNATELSAIIVKKVSGNVVANSINGSQLSRDTFKGLMLSRLQKQLSLSPSDTNATTDKVPAITQKVLLMAAGATENGVALYPQPGSPLALMSGMGEALQLDLSYLSGMSDNEVVESLASILEAEPTSDAANPYAAGDYQVTVNQISERLTEHISFMRNVIVPLIDEYSLKVNTDIEAPTNIMEKFDIRITDLAEPLNDEGFYSTIESSSGGNYVSPSVRIRSADVGMDTISKMLVTGSKSFDDAIAVWTAKLGEKAVLGMWSKVFGPYSVDLMEALASPDKADVALFTWLVAGRLPEEVPEGTGMTMAQLKIACAQYREVSAIALRQHVDNYRLLEKSGVLVLSYNDRTSVVNVHAKNYAKYISDGGKNEVILGAMLSDSVSTPRTINAMIENASKFLAQYESIRALENARYRNAMFERVKRSLVVNFADLLLQDRGEFEQNAWNKLGLTQAALVKRAEDIVAGINGQDTKDLYSLCIRVMTGARFYYTDAMVFLTSMNIAAKENKDIDAREAALVATVELTVDYVADQIVRTNV